MREIDNHKGGITTATRRYGTATHPKQNLRNTRPAGDAGP
nr:MAG TPA: hypothetical protein [Caudoviricetes sp.]